MLMSLDIKQTTFGWGINQNKCLMKIVINKEATQQRLNEEASRVIEKARDIAESGRNKFYHPCVRGERYDSYDLILLVQDLTEQSVYKAQFYRGDIVFKIRD